SPAYTRLVFTAPTGALVFAAAGSSEKSSSPTTRSPAPRAKRNSVLEGPMETMRSGRFGIATERPWKSVTLAGNAAALGDALALRWNVRMGLSPVVQLTARTKARRSAKRRIIQAHPFSRRCVGRERVTRRPEFGYSAVTVAGPCRNRTG